MSASRKLRVLFVDDEPRLLDGMRRAMHTRCTRWDTVFALGGAEALAELSLEPADVVVSDMRMPGMDGATLLGEIARRHPRTVRIVLSGQTDADAARRALTVAHQFLAKPIALPALIDTIGRLEETFASFDQPALQQSACAANTLPAAPSVRHEVERLCANTGTSVSQLASEIEQDPAMVAKLLQLAGSAFFGHPLRATGMIPVISYLGIDTICGILRDGRLSAPLGENGKSAVEVTAHQQHSLLVARIARRIVPDRALADDAFCAGLLHDVGMLLPHSPNATDECGAALSAYLLGIWGLPRRVVDSVAHRHGTEGETQSGDLETVTLAANSVAHEYMNDRSWSPDPSSSAIDLDVLGITSSALHGIAEEESTAMASARS